MATPRVAVGDYVRATGALPELRSELWRVAEVLDRGNGDDSEWEYRVRLQGRGFRGSNESWPVPTYCVPATRYAGERVAVDGGPGGLRVGASVRIRFNSGGLSVGDVGTVLDVSRGSLFTFSADGGHTFWSLTNEDFELVDEPDPAAPPPPPKPKPFRFRNLLLPLPKAADRVTVQVQPNPSVTAHVASGPQTCTVYHFGTHRLDLTRPDLALTQDLTLNGLGGLAQSNWSLYAEDRQGGLVDVWRWANVYDYGRICWGRSNPVPKNPRAAWATFWDCPANADLAQFTGDHASGCRTRRHACQSYTWQRCLPRHQCSGADQHHACSNRQRGVPCGNHRLRVADPTWSRAVENQAIIDCRVHLATAAEREAAQRRRLITWPRCWCVCCQGMLRPDPTGLAPACGCGPAVACNCCNNRCDCVDSVNCLCCRQACRCRSGCECCDGACRCAQACTCDLTARYLEFLGQPRPLRGTSSAEKLLRGTAGVARTAPADAVLLTDDAAMLERVPERHRVGGALVGWAKRSGDGLLVTFGDGPDATTLTLDRSEVNLCA